MQTTKIGFNIKTASAKQERIFTALDNSEYYEDPCIELVYLGGFIEQYKINLDFWSFSISHDYQINNSVVRFTTLLFISFNIVNRFLREK